MIIINKKMTNEENALYATLRALLTAPCAHKNVGKCSQCASWMEDNKFRINFTSKQGLEVVAKYFGPLSPQVIVESLEKNGFTKIITSDYTIFYNPKFTKIEKAIGEVMNLDAFRFTNDSAKKLTTILSVNDENKLRKENEALQTQLISNQAALTEKNEELKIRLRELEHVKLIQLSSESMLVEMQKTQKENDALRKRLVDHREKIEKENEELRRRIKLLS